MAPSASPTYPLTLGSLGEVSGHVENQGDSGDDDEKDDNDEDDVEKDNGSDDNGDDDEVVLWLMKPSLAAARQ